MLSKAALETIFTFCLLIFSAWVVFESWGLSLGDLLEMGPGFFLFFGALLMAILCVSHLRNMWRKSGKSGPAFSSAENMKRLGWTLLITLLYGLLFNTLGFILVSAAFMASLLVLVGEERWGRAAVVSGIVVMSGYVIFSVLLRIPLPTGVFGF